MTFDQIMEKICRSVTQGPRELKLCMVALNIYIFLYYIIVTNKALLMHKMDVQWSTLAEIILMFNVNQLSSGLPYF